MRRHSNANSNAAPCKNHRAKDNDDLNEILSLVRHEVTTHFRQLDAYPNLIGPRQTGILAYLRAMQGMWTTPLVGSTVAPGAWLYEISGCAACMLTRICADTDALCYLYVVVKSRTRTRDRDHPRRLMAFIEECMGSHGPNMVSLMNDIMSADAVQMKIVRKACMKAWMLDVRLKGSLPSQRESPSIESRKITADGAAS
ncbi:hypothetical protein N7470_004040 [Penicillium chermesinum]|nr:hypothetical protein N7470_004040 [Penicillium chermesinum]